MKCEMTFAMFCDEMDGDFSIDSLILLFDYLNDLEDYEFNRVQISHNYREDTIEDIAGELGCEPEQAIDLLAERTSVLWVGDGTVFYTAY